MTPLITVGMAVYDDFDGVFFTIQSMRMNNDLRNVEILVVDNNPTSRTSRHIKNFLSNCRSGTAGATYIAQDSPVGTSSPRNRVFSEASGNLVVCLDSHVLTPPGALSRLLSYYHDTGTDALLSGPLVYDNLQTISTHFNDEWSGEMWGTWGQAWICRCKRIEHPNASQPQPLMFSVIQKDNKAHWLSMPDSKPVHECHRCSFPLPDSINYGGHEERLLSLGYTMAGAHPNDPPFEIPGQGLGLFACRKDAWLGFNDRFKSFGGEEMYIHEKFRQAGRKCMCLPFLRWVHRFYRETTSYPRERLDMIRNYIIGHQELGLPLDRVYQHFVTENRVTESQWNELIASV